MPALVQGSGRRSRPGRHIHRARWSRRGGASTRFLCRVESATPETISAEIEYASRFRRFRSTYLNGFSRLTDRAAGRTEAQVRELAAALRPRPAPMDLLGRLPEPKPPEPAVVPTTAGPAVTSPPRLAPRPRWVVHDHHVTGEDRAARHRDALALAAREGLDRRRGPDTRSRCRAGTRLSSTSGCCRRPAASSGRHLSRLTGRSRCIVLRCPIAEVSHGDEQDPPGIR